MNNTESFIDSFKERLSNPIAFTYFWVFCVVTRKEILILFFESDRIKNKIGFLSEWQNFALALFFTIIAVIALPWINNGVEILKIAAKNWMDKKLDSLGWERMVKVDVHRKVVDERNILDQDLRSEKSKNIEIIKEKNKLQEEFESLNNMKRNEEDYSHEQMREKVEKMEKENADLRLINEMNESIKEEDNLTEEQKEKELIKRIKDEKNEERVKQVKIGKSNETVLVGDDGELYAVLEGTIDALEIMSNDFEAELEVYNNKYTNTFEVKFQNTIYKLKSPSIKEMIEYDFIKLISIATNVNKYKLTHKGIEIAHKLTKATK